MALALDPVVHGVTHHQLGRLYLAQHVELQHRIDVAQEEVLGVAPAVGELGPEIGKHPEPGLQGLPALQVVAVLPLPAEALALGVLDPRPVDPALGQPLQLADRIVAPDDPDHLDPVEQRGSDAEIDRRAA